MRSPEFSMGVSETQYVGNQKVTTEVQKPVKKVIPGSVAKHESEHIIPALANGTGVIMATVIPGEGYLGLTQLSRPDAVAAAAPHGNGRSGTGHDMAVVEYLNMDAHAAASAGKAILDANPEKVDAVATLLEERGTVTGFEIMHAIDVAERKEEKVQVTVEDLATGARHVETVHAERGIVVFDSRWVREERTDYDDDLPIAA